ncbi:MAG: hypothetical protein J5701_05830 [Bacteroidales bacterium]|nr:hypothetical protein [Bacteroidales bacterium]
MNIKREQISNLHEMLTITFEGSDYKDLVEKSLKDLKRKAAEPGFRQGHVPMSIINSKYGKSVLVDEISKLTNDKLYQYIKDENLNILFEPIAIPEKTQGDFDHADTFSFSFEIGLCPEITVDYEDAKKVVDYHITATDTEINAEIDNMRKRVGKFSSTEEAVAEDMLMVKVTPETGEPFSSALVLSYLKDEYLKDFIGKKLHEEISIDTTAVFKSDYERSTFLKVKMDELATAPATVNIAIDAIHHVEPADLNEDFFNKMFPDGSVKDENQLHEKIKSQIELRYVNDANIFYRNKVIDTMLEHAGITLPDNFIKAYLVETNDKYTSDNIDEQYGNIQKSISYQLLEDKIAKDCEIKIEAEDVSKYIKDYIRLSYFGSATVLPAEQEAQVENFAQEMMKKQENFRNAYENLFFEKITEGLRAKLTPKVKELSYQEFVDEMSGEPKKAKTPKKTKTPKKDNE